MKKIVQVTQPATQPRQISNYKYYFRVFYSDGTHQKVEHFDNAQINALYDEYMYRMENET